ncbi:hypothetical protein AMST5_01958 [freshwater sediment metagenome]|uniref:Uncharacterized protein n=1 Tax=freshwater sediment metagenome TaxID=556182 RepID=A0AA48R9Q3_9ZZZZ
MRFDGRKFLSMSEEFKINAANAAEAMVRIASYDLLNARRDAVSVMAKAVAELETLAARRAETDARVKANLRQMAERRDGLKNLLDSPEPSFDFPNDEARKSAAASMDAETARLRKLGADYLAGLLADLDAERALVNAKSKDATA